MTIAGVCVRCGGPNVWTTHAGEVWVACEADCLDEQLLLDGSRNPPLIALCDPPEGFERVGTILGREGRGPPEGHSAKTSDVEEDQPPRGWLSTLWEGAVSDG